MRIIIFVFALMLLIPGCSVNTKENIPKEFTLDEIISSFETLVWEMHNKDGITEKRVKEILGMELTQASDFRAVYVADTGMDNVYLAISRKKDSQELFSNASLDITTNDLSEPLSVDLNDLLSYRTFIEPGTKLEYFEDLFGISGILTDYMKEIFKYRWWTDDFIVIIEVDENFEVQWFDLVVNQVKTQPDT